MTQHIRTSEIATLGELIKTQYANFDIVGGSASMDMDISHGYDIETFGSRVQILPYVKWTDGAYKPCHYWGAEYYIYLKEA